MKFVVMNFCFSLLLFFMLFVKLRNQNNLQKCKGKKTCQKMSQGDCLNSNGKTVYWLNLRHLDRSCISKYNTHFFFIQIVLTVKFPSWSGSFTCFFENSLILFVIYSSDLLFAVSIYFQNYFILSPGFCSFHPLRRR